MNAALWQPIETAPKDGTYVLLCRATNADGKPIAGSDGWGVSVQVAAWWEGDDEWIVYCSMVREPRLHFDPTHWMPLPGGPECQPQPINWPDIESRLGWLERSYAEIGSLGYFVREHVLRPLRDRWNAGERTEELAREISEVSL